MKATVTLLAFVLLVPVAASAQDGRLRLDFLDRLADRASESANVDVPKDLLDFGSSFLPKNKDTDVAKRVMSGLEGIYVRSFEFDSDNAYSDDDIEAIRKQLTAPGWVRLIRVQEKQDRELFEVYSFRRDGRSIGLAIIAAESRELAVINIVGPLDLSQLPALGGAFGIPRNIPGLDNPNPNPNRRE